MLTLQEFCEDCDNRTKLVQRSAELRSNDSLPAAFERATGERIYDGLLNGFRVRCTTYLCERPHFASQVCTAEACKWLT